MKACSRCRRHLLTFATPCPFCGQDHRTVSDSAVFALGLAIAFGAAACGETGKKTTETVTDGNTGPGTETDATKGGSDSSESTTTGTTTNDAPTTAGTDTNDSVGSATNNTTDPDPTVTDSSDDGGSYYAGPSTESDPLWGKLDPAKQ